MQTLRMLGGIGLSRSDGAELDALLRQPKSVALLAYLAMPRPGAWHRRDLLLATFWPELSQSGARAALRSALHLLRRHLDEDTIRTRGDDEVAVDETRLTTDVAALLHDVAANERARALSHYGGLLLPGLYISDAPEFERWLEAERARLHEVAVRTATALVTERDAAGDVPGATDAARRAAELSPDDESAARRLIALLDRTGQRTQALAVYERLRTRAAAEFGAAPSPETAALVEKIRRRPPLAAATTPHADQRPTTVEAPDAPAVAASGAPTVSIPLPRPRPIGPRLAALVLVLAVTAAAVALTAAYWHVRPANSPAVEAATSTPRRLVLLPVENGARDSTRAYVAPGVGYGITRRLERLGNLSIRFASRAEASLPTQLVLDPSMTFGPSVLLRVTIDSVGDSLDVRASLLDSASRRGREVVARRLARGELSEVESQVAAAVTGALHRVEVPFAVRHDDRPVNPEAYRLTILGYHQLITLGDDVLALRSFVRATELDPFYARAWAGMASVWGLRTGLNMVPFDEGYERTAAAASRALALDSTQGSALASLGGVTALKYRRLEAGTPLIRRAMLYEPSNPEVFVIASFLHRYSHQWDEARDLVRVARQLDPVTVSYPLNEANVEFCAGRPEAAERVLRGALDQNPARVEAREGLARALALQHRFDEALDVWRAGVGATTPPELTAMLAHARGREGYLAAVHTQGKQRLQSYRRAVAGKPVSPLRMLMLQFQAGDSAAGFASLEQAVRERAEWTYRLPCFAPVDEFRDTPHYRTLASEIGAMPLR